MCDMKNGHGRNTFFSAVNLNRISPFGLPIIHSRDALRYVQTMSSSLRFSSCFQNLYSLMLCQPGDIVGCTEDKLKGRGLAYRCDDT